MAGYGYFNSQGEVVYTTKLWSWDKTERPRLSVQKPTERTGGEYNMMGSESLLRWRPSHFVNFSAFQTITFRSNKSSICEGAFIKLTINF